MKGFWVAKSLKFSLHYNMQFKKKRRKKWNRRRRRGRRRRKEHVWYQVFLQAMTVVTVSPAVNSNTYLQIEIQLCTSVT